jgi:hypothetical protein
MDKTRYYDSNGIETFDIIKAYNLNFCMGNVIKYALRAGRKTPDLKEDLEKAIVYLCAEYLTQSKIDFKISEVKDSIGSLLKHIKNNS